MTTPIKVIVMLALWLLYSLIIWFGGLQFCCVGENTEDTAVTESTEVSTVPTKRKPIDFAWANAAANTNEGFDALKQRILDGMTETNSLEITGFYREEEPKPDGYDNMGFARAAALQSLISDIIPEERISLKARLVDEKEGDRSAFFEGYTYEWQEPQEQQAQTVEELDDRIIIRFPYNSTEKDYDPEVDAYLEKLAETIKGTDASISLTGHTDNKGAADYNQELGMRRAQAIKNILIGYGVSADAISTISKGQSQPVASNNTDGGRHENRRVEVRYNKN